MCKVEVEYQAHNEYRNKALIYMSCAVTRRRLNPKVFDAGCIKRTVTDSTFVNKHTITTQLSYYIEAKIYKHGFIYF